MRWTQMLLGLAVIAAGLVQWFMPTGSHTFAWHMENLPPGTVQVALAMIGGGAWMITSARSDQTKRLDELNAQVRTLTAELRAARKPTSGEAGRTGEG